MPYTLRKRRNKKCYSVKNRKHHFFSKCTTLNKAKAQIRLLKSIDRNKLNHK